MTSRVCKQAKCMLLNFQMLIISGIQMHHIRDSIVDIL